MAANDWLARDGPIASSAERNPRMQSLSLSSSSFACPVPWTPVFSDETEDTGQENRAQEIHSLVEPYVLPDDLLADTSLSVDTGPLADDLTTDQVFVDASEAVRLPAGATEEERRLVERARAGDYEARAALVLRILPRLKRIAIWYARAYSWACPHLDAQDLVQNVCLHMWQQMEIILAARDPLTFLTGMTRSQVRWQVLRLASVPPSLSLDLPDPEDEDTPFHETLPTSVLPASPYAQETKDYQMLYQALDALPEEQRTLLAQRYGLFTCAPLSQTQLERATVEAGEPLPRHRIRYQEQCALVTLFSLLREQMPAYQEAEPPLAPHSLFGKDEGQSQHLARLSRAAHHLQEAGQPLTIKALAKLAHVSSDTATCYLWAQDPHLCEQNQQRHQRKQQLQMLEGIPPHERLEAAYAQLQEAGQPLTVKALAKLAHVGTDTAQQYLQHLHPLRYGRTRHQQHALSQQRLEEAYARLQRSGARITVSGLIREAHVPFSTASAYLKARQEQRTDPASQT